MNSIRRRRRVALYLVLVAAAVGGAAALALRTGAGDPLDEVVDTPERTFDGAALTVSLVRPMAVVWPDSLTVNGPISAWQEAVVSAEVGGVRLVEVLADVGDQVSRNQLLARLDAAPLEAAYAQQNAALAEAQARLVEAEANVERARRLRQSQVLSEFDLIKASSAAEALRALVDLARARLLTEKLALDHSRVVAPDDGVITSRSAMLGAVAVPGTELFRLVRQNRLEWHAELTAADLAAVQPGQSAQMHLPGGGVVAGEVRQVAPVLDANTRTGIAYVAVPSGHATLRPGMFASGTILIGQRAGLSLPESAIVQRDGYEFVFRVRPESQRVLQTKVISGRRLEGNVEILEGISADDDVVESGGAFLSDGDAVRIQPRQVSSRDTGSGS